MLLQLASRPFARLTRLFGGEGGGVADPRTKNCMIHRTRCAADQDPALWVLRHAVAFLSLARPGNKRPASSNSGTGIRPVACSATVTNAPRDIRCRHG